MKILRRSMENDMSERIGGGYLGMFPHARNIDRG